MMDYERNTPTLGMGCRRWLHGRLFLPMILLSAAFAFPASAALVQVVNDDFSASHTYWNGSFTDVSGTAWDGVWGTQFISAMNANNGIAGSLEMAVTAGSGSTIVGVQDCPHLYKTVAGDFEAICHVREPWPAAAYDTIGILAGDHGASGANHATLHTFGVIPGTYMNRNENGARTIDDNLTSGTAHPWLRMVRVGDSFTMYTKRYEADAWQLGGSFALHIPDPVHVGPFMATHDAHGGMYYIDKFEIWQEEGASLSISPAFIRQRVPLGQSCTAMVSMVNGGNAAATVAVSRASAPWLALSSTTTVLAAQASQVLTCIFSTAGISTPQTLSNLLVFVNSGSALPTCTVVMAACASDTGRHLRQLLPSSRRTGLIISELMYDAPQIGLEFIEIFNTEPFDHDMGGYRLAGAVEFTFPKGTILPARSFLVVAEDPSMLHALRGYAGAYGPYTGKLDNNGETLQLVDHRDAILLEVPYNNEEPWPLAASGVGHSLVLDKPDYGEGDARAWCASAVMGGNPGFTNQPMSSLAGVVINEMLTATTAVYSAFIELLNAGTTSATLTGCLLAHDTAMPMYRITNSVALAAGGRVSIPFSAWGVVLPLEPAGGRLMLLNPSTNRVVDMVRWRPEQPGVSRGRYPDGGAGWCALRPPTSGTRNTNAYTRDIVIKEIMYHPLSDDSNDEYIELYNKGTGTVDISGWRISGGIAFIMPTNSVILSNRYVVVARNMRQMLTNYPGLSSANTRGNFTGKLGNGGDRVTLSMPVDPLAVTASWIVVDEVTYGDGWGTWTDGGGSSLELVNPRSDNSIAANWAGSIESNRAPWTAISITGVLDNGALTCNELQIFMTDAGECLLDSVFVATTGETTRVLNGGFESGITGWVRDGNHGSSAIDTGRAYAGMNCLRIIASGGGDNGVNRVEKDLTSSIASGSMGVIRAYARWLGGHRILVLRLYGGYLEVPATLSVHKNPGTPGAQNSTYAATSGPAVSDVAHLPVLPAEYQPVVISARLDDPNGVASALCYIREDPATASSGYWMNDGGTDGDVRAGDGVWSCRMSGLASNALMAFYIEANGGFATTRWPDGGREGLVMFGQRVPESVFGSYHMWMTASNMTSWINRQNLNNALVDCTFVYGGHRVVYKAGTRERGSPWIRSGYGPPNTFVSSRVLRLSKDERIMGNNAFNLDSLEQQDVWGGSRDATFIRERAGYYIGRLLGIPTMNQRYVHMYLNGWKMGVVFADTQDPDGDYLSEWSPYDTDGDLFEVDDWFEFNDANPIGFASTENATLQNFNTTGGAKKQARYRFSWEKKPVSAADDSYLSLFGLVDAMNMAGTGYYDAVNAVVDWDGWMRSFSLPHIGSDWDHYGYDRGKNGFAYKPVNNRWMYFVWDMDISFGAQGVSPTAELFSINDPVLAGRFFQEPAFRRAFWRALYDAATGPMLHVLPVIDDYYSAFILDGQATADVQPVKDWIDQRRIYILGQLGSVSAPFAITTAAGTNFVTSSPVVTIAGTAPVQVDAIRVNGSLFPVRWMTVTSWSITIGLVPGPNALVFQGHSSSDALLPGMTDSIVVTYSGSQAPPYGAVVINEIMYHPAKNNAEFIELYNRSATYPIPLTNFFFDRVMLSFPGDAVIAPNGYCVVGENTAGFREAYGSGIPLAAEYAGKLENAGEALRLLRRDPASGVTSVIDVVAYGDAAPWPTDADGLGPSLQLIDAAQDNNCIANWGASITPLYTPGARNVISRSLPPIPNIRINELQPVNTNFADNAAELDPWIELVVSGSLSTCYLTDDAALPFKWPVPLHTPLTNTKFLVAWADGEAWESATNAPHMSFRLSSTNGMLGLAAVFGGVTSFIDAVTYGPVPGGRSYGSYPDADPAARLIMSRPTPGAPNMVAGPSCAVSINEWMAANATTIADPADLAAGLPDPYDDWFELYNPGPDLTDLSGCTLSDGSAVWYIPDGVVLGTNAFMLVWADSETNQNGFDASLHADFKLSAGGEQIILSREGSVVDQVTFGPQQTDISGGRWPDATADVYDMGVPTPGQSNVIPEPACAVAAILLTLAARRRDVEPGSPGYPSPRPMFNLQ